MTRSIPVKQTIWRQVFIALVIIIPGLVNQCDAPVSLDELSFDIEVLHQDLSSNNRAVFFVDSHTGYVASYSGRIIKTTDGGVSWTLQSSGTTKQLHSLYFINEHIGFAAGGCSGDQCGGAESVILKTTDGGTIWIKQSTPTSVELSDLYFLDEMRGFAVGFGFIVSTSDGGETWVAEEFEGENFRSVWFVNENNGYVSGIRGTILRTVDSGETWSRVITGTDIHIYTLHFPNENVGYGAGQGKIIKTTNGGKSWFSPDDSLKEIFSLHFLDPSRGFAVGRGEWSGGDFGHNYGALHVTSDGCRSWESNTRFADAILLAIHFPNNAVGFAVGGGSNIIKIMLNM